MNEIPQPRVSRLTLSRLHNLGNYEHVRYEITVEVPEGASAAGTFRRLEQLLNELEPKPTHDAWEIKRARETLAKPAGELSATERTNLDLYARWVAEEETRVQKRTEAADQLDALGAVAVHTDAKEKWEDSY